MCSLQSDVQLAEAYAVVGVQALNAHGLKASSVNNLQAHRVHMASGCRVCPGDGGDAQQWLSRWATTSRAAL